MRGLSTLLLLCCSVRRRSSGFVLNSVHWVNPRGSFAHRGSVQLFYMLDSPQSSTSDIGNNNNNATASVLKERLLLSLGKLREKQARDGDFSINFGVKGGELNQTSRAPQRVSYYAISEEVGLAADEVMSICRQLAEVNPTQEPTKFLGDKKKGAESPLHGSWKLLFTTAADASFSKNSTRGDALVKNVVNACRGRITNIIDFESKRDKDASSSVLAQLHVVIRAVADGPKRVLLTFRYAKVIFSKFFFIPIRWALYIPVPGPFITRCIVLLYRLFTFGKSAKQPPKAYFDVLYVDHDLRIHKTGEDNLFVQAKESWEEANKLVE